MFLLENLQVICRFLYIHIWLKLFTFHGLSVLAVRAQPIKLRVFPLPDPFLPKILLQIIVTNYRHYKCRSELT